VHRVDRGWIIQIIVQVFLVQLPRFFVHRFYNGLENRISMLISSFGLCDFFHLLRSAGSGSGRLPERSSRWPGVRQRLKPISLLLHLFLLTHVILPLQLPSNSSVLPPVNSTLHALICPDLLQFISHFLQITVISTVLVLIVCRRLRVSNIIQLVHLLLLRVLITVEQAMARLLINHLLHFFVFNLEFTTCRSVIELEAESVKFLLLFLYQGHFSEL